MDTLDVSELAAFRAAANAAAVVLQEEDVGAMMLSVCTGETSENLALRCEFEGAEDAAEQAARWRARRDVERALLPIVRRLAGPLPKPPPVAFDGLEGLEDDGVPF